MGSAIEEYRAWADGMGESILDWARNGQQDSTATKGWFLTDFASALAIVGVYLILVMVGPWVMSTRAPIDSYRVRFVYNVVQIVICSYMFVEALVVAYRNGCGVLPCVPFNAKNPPVANVVWLFYLSKGLDLLDTLFIVLKKSWRQLSFLHIFHHGTIFLVYWFTVNAFYDGDVFLSVVLNGFIHTVMYIYYFVSMHTKDIWWKKYLTVMQMVQFVWMAYHMSYMIGVGCAAVPWRVGIIYTGYFITLLFLFAHFYVTSYTKKLTGGASHVNGSKTHNANGSKFHKTNGSTPKMAG